MVRNIAVNPEAFEGQGEYAPIPNGSKVQATIFAIKEGVAGPNSKNPGKPQAEYTVKVVEDFVFTHTNEDGTTKEVNARGREIKYNYFPLDGTVAHAWQLTAFADAVGWKSDPTRGVEVPDDLNEVLGTQVTIQVEAQPDRNDPSKVYNRVRRISKAKAGGGGGATKPAESGGWGSI